ncbi:flagellar protein [Cytobacillus spongiae]|uniref:TIGR02530 family flagellar biosynthesis protein n=1 Tax=Cytobacillus spongiae TaxID=2901381 RepID=UPI001F238AD1|nr:TIGR02530 family flagellar biosynthesis protein [Cytobacillus spongiae]UII57415.1 flagellar protein [Cytobacillus spongiae]
MNKPIYRPIQTQPVTPYQVSHAKEKQVSNQSFSNHFQAALLTPTSRLTISKHANERLVQRNILINEKQWTTIESKVQEAKKMGVKESLVLLKDAALIISAKNNTVITAMDRQEASSQIFTNINGTIVLE